MNQKRIILFAFFLSGIQIFAWSSWNPAIENFIAGMKKNYHVDIEILSAPKTSWEEDLIHFKNLDENDEAEITRYVEIFRSEFFKYPFAFIKNTGLKKVVLVKELYNSGVPVAAMPDYYQEYLYMDIYLGNSNPLYQRHVIHHEFYHMIEQELNGDAYYKDPAWNNFNIPGFKYGNGGINNRESDMSPITHPDTGFINLYSKTGLEEDKAEIYAALMTDEEKALILPWMSIDPALKNKIEYMIGFLKKYKLSISIHS